MFKYTWDDVHHMSTCSVKWVDQHDDRKETREEHSTNDLRKER